NKLYEIVGLLGIRGAGAITDEQASDAARAIAALRIQDRHQRNMFRVGEGEGLEYQTNYLAVQDLRRAINEFRTATAGDPRMDSLIAQAEKELLQAIENKDSEISKEIRSRGAKVAVMGAITTFAAACLAPGAKKGLEVLWNKGADAMGLAPGAHFDTSK